MALPTGTIPLNGHEDDVYHIVFLPDESRIVTACLDHKARVYDATNGVLQHTFADHDDYVFGLDALGGATVASGDYAGVLCVWDAYTGTCTYREQERDCGLWAIAALDERRFVVGSWDGAVLVFGHRKGRDVVRVRTIPRVHAYCIRSIAVHGDRMITGSWDMSARVWDATVLEVCSTLTGHAERVVGVAINDKHIITTTGGRNTGYDKGGVYIWSAKSFGLLRKFEETYRNWIYSPLILGNTHFLTVSSDENILVTEMSTGASVHRFLLPFSTFNAATTLDGRIAACGSRHSAVIFPAPRPIAKLLSASEVSNGPELTVNHKAGRRK